MEVVLYDTEHFETLETLLRLLDDGRNVLHVAVPVRMRRELEALGIREGATLRWHPLPEANSAHAAALGRITRNVRASLLLLGTVSFRQYAFARMIRRLRGVRVLLGVHDVEDTFRPQRGKGFRGLLRRWGLQQLVHSVSGFMVLLPEMETHIRQSRYTDKPVYVVPGRLFNEGSYKPSPLPLRIVVPGSVDAARRDYDVVERLLRRLSSARSDIRLIIVGALPATGERPRWFDDYPEFLEVRCDRFVPAADYASALSEAGLVWAPLPEHFEQAGRPPETYGLTKSSGTFFDAISAGKPLLLPGHVPVPEALRGCTLVYFDETHLYYLLTALAANEAAFARLQSAALEAARRFTPELLRDRNVAKMTGDR